MFSAWDWLVVASYFAAMAGIGFYFSRRNRNFEDFMFGGGDMPWLAVGVSLIATSVSASTFLGYPADSYAQDMRLIMLNAGSLLAIGIIAIVFIPRFRRSHIDSAYELLEKRFSRPVRKLAAVLYSLHLLLRMGLLIYVPSLVLKDILHAPLWISICIMSAAAILYTYHGGLKAVTWTDVIQFLIFFGTGCLALWICAQRIGSWHEAFHAASLAGKTRWHDFTFDPASARNFWSAGVVYACFEVAIRGCDQQFVQRYLSCRNVREANFSSFLSGLLGIAVGLTFFLLGAFLFVYYQVKHAAPLPVHDVNQVFPYFILTTLPPGTKGVLVAALLAAAMSSQSSALTALSNTTVIDFLGPTRERGLRSARKWVVIWGILGALAAFICTLGNISILTKALFFTSLFTGPLLGLFLLAFFRPGLNPQAVLYAAVGGMLFLLLFLKIPVLPAQAWKPVYEVSWPWNPLISTTATVVFAQVLNPFFPKRTALPAG